MDFGKALEAMRAEKKVRRSTWNINYYIIYDDVHDKNEYPFGSFDGITTYKDGTYSRNLFEFSPEHLIAEDWEIVEDIPEVKLHIKEYFTCPKCGHVNIGFYIDYHFSTCKECGTKVKTLPRCDRVNKKYEEIVGNYHNWLEKMIHDFDSQIRVYIKDNQIQKAGNFDHSLSTFNTCLKMLNKLETESSEQENEDTNQH